MAQLKAGLLVDSLGLSARDGLVKASELGFASVQLAARGQIDPRGLARTGRRHLMKYVQGLGLTLAGFNGDPGGRRFADPAKIQEHIDRAKAALELSVDVGAPLVTLQAGGLPTDIADPASALVIAGIREVAEYADRIGAVLALESAGDAPDHIRSVLRTLGNPSLKVNYDPAGQLMAGRDPLAGIAAVAEYIASVRARDAVGGSRRGEVPMGQGELDYRAVLGALAEAGYRGVHTVTRERSDNPAAELAAAKRYLEGL